MKKSVTSNQHPIVVRGASAKADGVKEISSPEENTSSSDKIATDSKSAPNSNSKNAIGLPMGNEIKRRVTRNSSDSKKGPSISSKEENEVDNEGIPPSDDVNIYPLKQSKKRSFDDEDSSSDSSQHSKTTDNSLEKKGYDRRRSRDDSSNDSPEPENSDDEEDNDANTSTLPSHSYLDLSITDSSNCLATQNDMNAVTTHIRNVLEANKRNDSLLVLLTDLFEKGYWRSELQRNEEYLNRLFQSNELTVAEIKWCNNTFIRMISDSQTRTQSSNSQATITGIREIKPLLIYPPGKAQIEAVEHELDQPNNKLINKEIMSKQFADRLEIRMLQSLQSDNPLELEANKVRRLFSHNSYSSKEVITFLKHFFLHQKIEKVSNLTPTQLINDLTVNEFHTKRDDLHGQLAMEEKLMKWLDQAPASETTPSEQTSMCKLLIKRLIKDSELRIEVEKQWNNYSPLDTNVKSLLSLIGAVRDTSRRWFLEAVRFSESENSVKSDKRIEKRPLDLGEIRDTHDKKSSKKSKHSSGSKSSKTISRDVITTSTKPCKFCGHKLGIHHLDGTDGGKVTCILRSHPQTNKTAGQWVGSKLQLEWGRSSNNIRGGVHYTKLMDGTAWVNPDSSFKPAEKKSNTFQYIYDDIYSTDNKIEILSNLNSLNNANPYIYIKLFQTMEKGDTSSTSLKVQALLDTGSLAGDFISYKILLELPLPLLVYNTDFSVCSGMDGNCIDKLDAIDLYVTMCTENALSNNRLVHINDLKKFKNNKFVFKTSFYILKDTNIECVIGRDTIKKQKLVEKFHSHFHKNEFDCTYERTKSGSVIPATGYQGSQNSPMLIDTQSINLSDDDNHDSYFIEDKCNSSEVQNICSCVTCTQQDHNSLQSRVETHVSTDYDECSNRSSFPQPTSEIDISTRLDRTNMSIQSEVRSEYNSLIEAIRPLGASTSALRYERARVCTALSTNGTGMIPYRGDGFSVSKVTPREMLLERQLRLQTWNINNPESNYLSSIYGSARFSDNPPNSLSTNTKRNPNWGTIATLIKRQEQSLVDEVNDEDGINESRHDAFAPWINKPISDSTKLEDILDQITVEGDEDLRFRIRQLLERYRHVFSKTLSKEPANIPPFDLNVDTAKWSRPANRGPPRVQTPLKQLEIFKQVDELLQQGIIVESQATYYSQVILASKPDNKWRFCIDYRSLNDCTESASWPIPNIKEMFTRLGNTGSDTFGVMDLTSGYHQAPVSLSTQIFTAFITFCGIYQFTRSPFGPKRAPSYFQQMMTSIVLAGLLYFICEMYLDDCIVYAKGNDEFIIRLDKVLSRFEKHNIFLNPKKCKFGLKKVEYCGREISVSGLSISKKQIQTVLNFPKPVTRKHLKSFLGLVNYFRDYVPNHSTVVKPLNNLILSYTKLNGKATFKWSTASEVAYEAIRKLIESAPLLYFVNDKDPIFLRTDASDYGVGGYLYQKVDTIDKPIAFVSKSLTETQLKWSVIQKEAYGIYYSTHTLSYLLRDRIFTIQTDHKNLTFIKNDSNPMVVRWYLAMQELEYTLEHIPGVDNNVSDAFSRLCMDIRSPSNIAHTLSVIVPTPTIIPPKVRYAIGKVHNSLCGHHGLERSLKYLKDMNFTCKNLRRMVREFIRYCPACQKMSQIKLPIHAHPFTTSKYYPMECLNMDFVGPYPDGGYILVIIDTFTRWVELYHSPDATAESAASSLLQHFGRYGAATQIQSDRGPHFVAILIKEFLKLVGTEHCLTMAYSKEENSIVERANKEVNRHIRAYTFDTNHVKEYKNAIPLVMRILNTAFSDRTKISASSMLFGNALDLNRGIFLEQPVRDDNEPNVPLSTYASSLLKMQKEIMDKSRELIRQQDKNHLANYDTKRTEFPIGSLVLCQWREGKPPSRLHCQWKGPLRVISFQQSEYLLLDLVNNKEQSYHVKDLKQFLCDPLLVNPVDIARRDYSEFFIHHILAHKGDIKKVSTLTFLVEWYGYDESENSWEPWKNLRDTSQLHEYLARKTLTKLIPAKFRTAN